MEEQIKDFVDQTMGFVPRIDEVYHIGQNTPKAVVVVFPTMEEKRKIMRMKAELKNVTNEDGKKFYIQDYNPVVQIEKRRREQHIKSENEVKPDEKKLDIQNTKGGISIQGTIYRKKVMAPTPLELVQIPLDEYDAAMKTRMKKSKDIMQKNSKFIAFTKPVNSHSEIRTLYKRMKIQYPGARHIVCAYWIKGEEKHYTQDFCDDEEYGAGRILLEWMIQQNLECRVFFVIRYYGHIKMGTDRFECYKKAALSAMEGGDFNYMLNLNQECLQTDDKSVPHSNSAAYKNQNETGSRYTAKQTENTTTPKRGAYTGRGGYQKNKQKQAQKTYRPRNMFQPKEDGQFNFSKPWSEFEPLD